MVDFRLERLGEIANIMQKELFMRYIPAFIFGVLSLMVVTLVFDFTFTFSPIIDYLLAEPNLNADSRRYWLFMLHESSIFLFINVLIVFIYRIFRSKLPFNYLAVSIMQAPLFLMHVLVLQDMTDFSSLYQASTSVANTISAISMLLIYCAIKFYEGNIKVDIATN